jgi:hypothetical protein
VTDSRGGVGGLDPLYVEARRVLLNALFALRAHGSAIIVAGAQAIYLRTGASDMSIAPYTTDGDLAIDPSLLGDDPELELTMEGAGFTLKTQPGGHIEPGIWIVEVNVEGKPEVMPVDLIVPEGAASSTGRRGARLGPHGKRAARQIPGLEAVLVDHSPMVVTSLDPADRRSIEVEVAGVAALLVAKAHKLHDRLDQGKAHRLDDKDASDVVRIMQTTVPTQVGKTLAQLSGDEIAGQPTQDAVQYLDELFGRRGRPGIDMAARALSLAMDTDTVEVICTTYLAGIRAATGDSA